MKKLTAILALIVIVMAIVSFLLLSRCRTLSDEVDRQTGNVATALSQVEHYRAFGDSIQVASCRQLELTQKEYKELFAAKDKEIRQLRGVKHPTQVVEVEVRVCDTITLANTSDGADRLFRYSDKYITINGRSRPDTTLLDYSMRLPVNIVEHQKRKRFLGFLWYTRRVETVRVEVWSGNTKAVIEMVTSVRIE